MTREGSPLLAARHAETSLARPRRLMRVEDYYQQGKRWWPRLQEKWGKHHAVPVHHKAEAYLDAYLAAAGIAAEKDAPL